MIYILFFLILIVSFIILKKKKLLKKNDGRKFITMFLKSELTPHKKYNAIHRQIYAIAEQCERQLSIM